MKNNANIRQSQDSQGDLGSGATQITTAKGEPHWTQSGSSTEDIAVRADLGVKARDYTEFNAEEVPEFLANVTFKNTFVQKIYSYKKGIVGADNKYFYSTFYNPTSYAPVVEMHEIPTMGQVTDYLLKPDNGSISSELYFPGGVVTKYVGDHFDSDLSMWDVWLKYDPQISKPVQVDEWSRCSLARKLKYFLDEIVRSDGPSGGLPIHASTFYGGSQLIENGAVKSQVVRDFYAGSHKDVPTDVTSIFEVYGSATGTGSWKWIKLIYQNNQSGVKPVGIVGQFDAGEAITDFPTGTAFAFTDIDRYYLRDSTGKHTTAAGNFPGFRWINQSTIGQIQFHYDYVTVAMDEPAEDAAKILHTIPSSNYDIQLGIFGGTDYQHRYFCGTDAFLTYRRHQQIDNIYTHFGVSDTDFYPFYAKKPLNGVGDNCKMLLKTTSASSSNYHFLLSDAEETMYGTVANSQFGSFMKYYNNTGSSYVQSGMIGVGASSLFAIAQLQSGAPKYCKVPALHLATGTISTASEFIVTRPLTSQTMYTSSLLIKDQTATYTMNINPAQSSINQADPSTPINIEGVDFLDGKIKSPYIETPTIETPTIETPTVTTPTLQVNTASGANGTWFLTKNLKEYIFHYTHNASILVSSPVVPKVLISAADIDDELRDGVTNKDIITYFDISCRYRNQDTGLYYEGNFKGFLDLSSTNGFTAIGLDQQQIEILPAPALSGLAATAQDTSAPFITNSSFLRFYVNVGAVSVYAIDGDVDNYYIRIKIGITKNQ